MHDQKRNRYFITGKDAIKKLNLINLTSVEYSKIIGRYHNQLLRLISQFLNESFVM